MLNDGTASLLSRLFRHQYFCSKCARHTRRYLKIYSFSSCNISPPTEYTHVLNNSLSLAGLGNLCKFALVSEIIVYVISNVENRNLIFMGVVGSDKLLPKLLKHPGTQHFLLDMVIGSYYCHKHKSKHQTSRCWESCLNIDFINHNKHKSTRPEEQKLENSTDLGGKCTFRRFKSRKTGKNKQDRHANRRPSLFWPQSTFWFWLFGLTFIQIWVNVANSK